MLLVQYIYISIDHSITSEHKSKQRKYLHNTLTRNIEHSKFIIVNAYTLW